VVPRTFLFVSETFVGGLRAWWDWLMPSFLWQDERVMQGSSEWKETFLHEKKREALSLSGSQVAVLKTGVRLTDFFLYINVCLEVKKLTVWDEHVRCWLPFASASWDRLSAISQLRRIHLKKKSFFIKRFHSKRAFPVSINNPCVKWRLSEGSEGFTMIDLLLESILTMVNRPTCSARCCWRAFDQNQEKWKHWGRSICYWNSSGKQKNQAWLVITGWTKFCQFMMAEQAWREQKSNGSQ
jgi:hypothetical protein